MFFLGVILIISIKNYYVILLFFSSFTNLKCVRKVNHASNLNKTIVVRISICRFIYFTKKSNGMGTNMKNMVTQSL